MKVLFFLINLNLGGTEKSFLNLINALPSDVEVDLLMLENKGQLLQQLPSTVDLRVIEESDAVNFLIQNNILLYAIYCLKKMDILQMFRAIYFYFKSKFLNSSDFKFETIKNKFDIEKKKYDVAVAYAGPHQFISSYILRNVVAEKKIQWIHFDVSKINYNANASRNLYQYFDEIKVVSKEAEKKFLTFFPEFFAKTEVFYNIINKKEILSLSVEAGIGYQDQFAGLRIVTVGRLTEEKGHILAISAIRKLIDSGFNIRYYIIGEGSKHFVLNDLVTTLHLQNHVVFLGSKINPYPYMRQADIYLQPSFYEGHCVTILESKLLNKPILCTDFTGAEEELEQGKTGLIVKIDSNAIYDGLKRLIENKELRKCFEKNLRTENLSNIDHCAQL